MTIVRIVRMHFSPETAATFLAIFEKNREAIRNFPGCTHLELLRDHRSPDTYATLSHWNRVEDLEAYRNSELFTGVWAQVKPLFVARTEAVTYVKNL